jgi:hypothetical protein
MKVQKPDCNPDLPEYYTVHDLRVGETLLVRVFLWSCGLNPLTTRLMSMKIHGHKFFLQSADEFTEKFLAAGHF